MSNQVAQPSEMRRGAKAIRRHLKPFQRELVILSLLGLAAAATNGFLPFVTGRFFDALINVSQQNNQTWGNSQLPLWGAMLGLWALIQIVAGNLDWFIDRLTRRIEPKMHFKVQVDGFLKLLRLPVAYHKDAHINGVLERVSQAAWRISSILGTVADIGPQLVSILIGLVLALSINLTLTYVLLVGVLVYVVGLFRILKPIAQIDSAAHKAWNLGWNDAAAAVHQIESVKQASAEDHETEKVKKSLLIKAYSIWSQMERLWGRVSIWQQIVVFLTQLIVFWLSVKYISTGLISVGELVALNSYVIMFFNPLAQLGRRWEIIQNGFTTAAHAEELFSQKEEVYRPAGALSPEIFRGRVTFEDVSFSYGDKQTNTLHNISFQVEPGEVVALVGESGVGKSTAVSLISAYNFPSTGQVLIDNLDTRQLELTNLRRHIAVVPQEVALFNDTLKNNIRYGSFDASDEQVIQAAEEAHIAKFISELPQGYETVVGERGVKLSVGQKQRVAIARAILRQPAILVLDEPTSALDSATEKLVTESLEKLMRGRTTFIIAHRLSTVRKADRIIVFKQGRVVEMGTHKDLLKREGGVYRRLYEYQVGLH